MQIGQSTGGGLFALLLCSTALAQPSTLPQPTRTVFKCEVNGNVVYSDEPCVGAKRVDVEPTRGLNRSTGREVVGKDVARETQSALLSEAIRPITGMSAERFEVEKRRVYLAPEIKTECNRLDAGISSGERQEAILLGAEKAVVQQHLYSMRKRYREAKC
jgi:hypothetical protein